MDAKRPKRRRDKYNPYVLFEKDGGHYISFVDSKGELQTTEIDEELYQLFDKFELEDISHLHKVRKYAEHVELSDSEINQRAFYKPTSLVDEVIKALEYDELHKVISELPDVQRRRLVLYYFADMNYRQIAEMEGCTIMPVKRSIDQAIKKIRKKFL